MYRVPVASTTIRSRSVVDFGRHGLGASALADVEPVASISPSLGNNFIRVAGASVEFTAATSRQPTSLSTELLTTAGVPSRLRGRRARYQLSGRAERAEAEARGPRCSDDTVDTRRPEAVSACANASLNK